MGERSGERSGSRRSFRRLARRQVAALSLGRLGAASRDRRRARRDRRPHPARRDGRLHQRDGGGALRRRPCARLRARCGGEPRREERLRRLASVSNAVARLNRNTTTGAITQPAGTAGCISETGAGPCADGHGLDGRPGWRSSPDGKSVYVASSVQQRRRGAPQPQHDHRGDQPSPPGPPAASARRGRGPAPTAMGSSGPVSVAVSPDGKSVYVASRRDSNAVVRLNRNTTTGAITQPAGAAGCISETGAGPCADGHGLDYAGRGGGQPRREERLRRFASISDAVVRLNRNTTTGAITQPAGTAGCISETGAGPCANGHALNGANSVAVSPDGKSVYVASVRSGAVVRLNRNTTTGAISPARRGRRLHQPDGGGAVRRRPWARRPGRGGGQRRREERLRRLARTATPWRASTATRPPGRSPSPPGPPAASARRERGPAPTAMGSTTRSGWRSAPDGKSVYVASSGSDAVARFNRAP